MEKYQIIEVTEAKHQKEFIQLPVRLYKGQKNWIRPLDDDIEKVFDRKRNKYWRNGEAIRWIMTNEEGKTIGRVAAFIDQKIVNKGNDQPTGGMGFFECIEDQDAAFKLFDTAKAWLKDKGMEAMDGPINFGDRHENWGLLALGDFEPNYQMPYTYPYYIRLFEDYGFQVYFKQLTYARRVSREGVTQILLDKAERIARNPHFHFENVSKKNLSKYAEDFRTVYNLAWTKFDGVAPMSSAQSKSIMKKMKPIMDERLMVFVYYDEEPAGFTIMIPELNQIFKHVNGKMNWLGKLKFLYYRRKVNKALGVVFGVTPKHQGKGLEGAMIMNFAEIAWQKTFNYQDVELNWIGDFNPNMKHVVESVEFKIKKVHHTYRYLFDRTKEFKRMPMLK
ncbi:MAG: hypothetical protein JEZ03_01565 [Bacteroidales bacterium]|nr:hypothetical protein [Bacteroidales bacterium]